MGRQIEDPVVALEFVPGQVVTREGFEHLAPRAPRRSPRPRHAGKVGRPLPISGTGSAGMIVSNVMPVSSSASNLIMSCKRLHPFIKLGGGLGQRRDRAGRFASQFKEAAEEIWIGMGFPLHARR